MEEIDRFQSNLQILKELTKPNGHPNINALWWIAKDLQHLNLNVKFFGYEIAKRLAQALPERSNLKPVTGIDLKSKPSTQEDLESDWAAYWAAQLKLPIVFHRKLWEFVYLLQVLHDHNLLRADLKGLGFGCGEEPIASYLASRGIDVVVTDLSPDSGANKVWSATGQHTTDLEKAYRPELVERNLFDRHVSLQYVDMNSIPKELAGFDFCWSICALEHLGSIEHGLKFIENSIATLRPGGVAVHTTEFNFLNDNETLDNWPTVLFQRKHFQKIFDILSSSGHKVSPLDFSVGSKPMDRFIDVPPFAHDWSDFMKTEWGGKSAAQTLAIDGTNSLKLAIDGFACTCFGIAVQRSSV